MKIIPRFLFWVGTLSWAYAVILKIVSFVSGPAAWPWGLQPNDFLEFSLVCFVAAIAFCVIFIFSKKEE